MTILSLHIIAAILTLFLCALSWIRPKKKLLTPIIMLSLTSIITGVLLAMNSSLLATCAKLGFYSLVIVTSLYELKSKISAPTHSLN